MKDFALIIGCNLRMVDPMNVFLHSLWKNGNLQDIDFDFYLYTTDITKKDIKAGNFNINIVKINCNIYDSKIENITHFRKVKSYFDGVNIRINAINDLIQEYKTVIYFDVDIIVSYDISLLFKHLENDYDFAGIYDRIVYPSTFVLDWDDLNSKKERERNITYLNAGVMVLNSLNMQKYGDLVSLYLDKPGSEYLDQDFLNELIPDERKKIMPYKYNAFVHPNPSSSITAEQKKIHCNSAIKHYISQVKPWNSILHFSPIENNKIYKHNEVAYEYVADFEHYAKITKEIKDKVSKQFYYTVIRNAEIQKVKFNYLSKNNINSDKYYKSIY